MSSAFKKIGSFASSAAKYITPLLGFGGTIAQVGGNYLSDQTVKENAEKDRKQAQDQFDQIQTESVQNRVEDAQKAGISPLAAMGLSTSGAPSVMARRGGTYNGLTALGEMMNGAAQQREQSAEQAYRLREQEARLLEMKTRAEIDNVRMQTALAQQRVSERRLQLMATSAIAEHQKQGAGGYPMQVEYNSKDLMAPNGPVKPGSVRVLDPNLVEQLSIDNPIGIGAFLSQNWGNIWNNIKNDYEYRKLQMVNQSHNFMGRLFPSPHGTNKSNRGLNAGRNRTGTYYPED